MQNVQWNATQLMNQTAFFKYAYHPADYDAS